MALKTPIVEETRLFSYDIYTMGALLICDIVEDWDVWQNWLENRMQEKKASFRFRAVEGYSCTVVREYRKHFGGELRPVWYAHRRLGGKLRRKYIGKSENCTNEKLRAVAFALSQRTFKT